MYDNIADLLYYGLLSLTRIQAASFASGPEADGDKHTDSPLLTNTT